MFDLKKEKIKKNIFLIMSIIFALIFLLMVIFIIMGDSCPIKFIVNNSPIKFTVPSSLIFFVTFTLYRNSKMAIEENTK